MKIPLLFDDVTLDVYFDTETIEEIDEYYKGIEEYGNAPIPEEDSE